MAQRSNGEGTGPAAGSSRPEGFPSGRELIVIAKSETGLRARPEGVTSVTGTDVVPLSPTDLWDAAPVFRRSVRQMC